MAEEVIVLEGVDPKDADKVTRLYVKAGVAAVKESTKELERRLEAATQSAVPGRLWRAWTSRFYPNDNKDPAGIVYLKGGERTRGAVAFWTQPGAVRGREGQYLAIPLPAAGSRGRNRLLTPVEWEARNNQELQFLPRRGKAPLLVAVGGTTNGRTGAYRPLTGGKRGRIAQGRGGSNPLQSSVIPIFVLLPLVRHRNALALDPIINDSDGYMAQAFFANVRALGG